MDEQSRLSESGDLVQPPAQMARVARSVRVGLLGVSCAFVAYFLRDVDLSRFGSASLIDVTAAFGFIFVALAGMAALWLVLLRQLAGGSLPSPVLLLRVFARSWVARYLPGSAWAYGARLLHSDRSAISTRVIAVSLLDELTLVTLGSAALGVGLLAVDRFGIARGGVALVGAFGGAAFIGARLDALSRLGLRVLHGRLHRRTRLGRSLGQAAETPPLRLHQAAGLVSGYAFVCACGGFAFALLIGSAGPVPGGQLARFIGGFSIAVVAGIAVVVVPAGLGVREAVLIALLRPVAKAPVVVWAAVSYRVLALLVDGCFLILLEVLASSRGRAQGEDERRHEGSEGSQHVVRKRSRRRRQA